MSLSDVSPKKAAAVSRRQAIGIAAGSAALATFPAALSTSYAETPQGTQVTLRYPRSFIASLSRVRREPVPFDYPAEGNRSVLLSMEQPVEGGAGPNGKLVAFSTICPHQGGTLSYDPERPGLLGPCNMHFSAFDATRRGLMVQGQACTSLPQVVLEVVGAGVYAVAVTGLLYGHRTNTERRRP